MECTWRHLDCPPESQAREDDFLFGDSFCNLCHYRRQSSTCLEVVLGLSKSRCWSAVWVLPSTLSVLDQIKCYQIEVVGIDLCVTKVKRITRHFSRHNDDTHSGNPLQSRQSTKDPAASVTAGVQCRTTRGDTASFRHRQRNGIQS